MIFLSINELFLVLDSFLKNKNFEFGVKIGLITLFAISFFLLIFSFLKYYKLDRKRNLLIERKFKQEESVQKLYEDAKKQDIKAYSNENTIKMIFRHSKTDPLVAFAMLFILIPATAGVILWLNTEKLTERILVALGVIVIDYVIYKIAYLINTLSFRQELIDLLTTFINTAKLKRGKLAPTLEIIVGNMPQPFNSWFLKFENFQNSKKDYLSSVRSRCGDIYYKDFIDILTVHSIADQQLDYSLQTLQEEMILANQEKKKYLSSIIGSLIAMIITLIFTIFFAIIADNVIKLVLTGCVVIQIGLICMAVPRW